MHPRWKLSCPVPDPVSHVCHECPQVFGERYPDPVRVLSVGQEVVPMLEVRPAALIVMQTVVLDGGTAAPELKS